MLFLNKIIYFLKYIKNLENINKLCLEFTCLLDEEKILNKFTEILLNFNNVKSISVMLYNKTGILEEKKSVGFYNHLAQTVITIKFKSKILGILNLYSEKHLNKYELKIFDILSSNLAVALANAKFYKLAITDSLTGLYIQQYFKQRLEYEIELSIKYKYSICLLLFDIDYFKKINDNYGHQTGDFILRALSELIKQNLNQNNVFARYGGEEFTVIFPEISLEEAKQIAEDLRKKVEKNEFNFKNTKLKITISIGIGYFSPIKKKKNNEFNCEKLIQLADTALYQAKNSGRNCIKVNIQ